MEFHQLRYFVATAEELSITGAAKRLHLSQPALSRQILALEEELGVALFQRIKKRIHLTEAGRFFLDRCIGKTPHAAFASLLDRLESAARAIA